MKFEKTRELQSAVIERIIEHKNRMIYMKSVASAKKLASEQKAAFGLEFEMITAALKELKWVLEQLKESIKIDETVAERRLIDRRMGDRRNV